MATKKTKKFRKINIDKKNVLYVLSLIFLILAGMAVGMFVFAASTLPKWDPQQLTGMTSSIIYDQNDKAVSSLHAEENRTQIDLDQVPPDLVQAFVAIEDQNFYDHHGVNFRGIARAFFRNVQSGDMTGQGASSITQQLARNAFLSFDKRWERKLKEIILAFKLEATYSKDEIICMYMNKIYFGSGAYGVQAAANTFFGKDAKKLTLEECALLAGLPQSPNAYDPFQHFDLAKQRQQQVLNSMVHCGYIDGDTAATASDAPLHFKKSVSGNVRYGYYLDAVVDEAVAIINKTDLYNNPNDAIYRSGLQIYTALDPDVQSYAEEVYADSANFPAESKGGEIVQSAMVLSDYRTGEVKALMGGRNYTVQRGFNRAINAHRQPGSAIKPIAVYSPALESGIMPFYVLDDAPISFQAGGTVWSPQNYDGSFRGPITMRTGVQQSINTYAVQMVDKIGIRKSFDFAKSMGLSVTDTPGKNDLALAPLSLGGLTYGVTPVQMSAAFGTIANGGVYAKPHLIRKIIDADGVVIYTAKPSYNRVMRLQTAWLMSDLLRGVVTGGTGTAAAVPGVYTAGKTGTSEESNNVWFCGFTPAFSMSVWMGYDKNYAMSKQVGGGYPAKVFRLIMTKAQQGHNTKPMVMPSGIYRVSVCSLSGKLPSDFCPADSIISDYCTKYGAPEGTCDKHQSIYICPDSGLLAGKYCPYPLLWASYKSENSISEEQPPTQKCDIHIEAPLLQKPNNDYEATTGGEVYICTDPRHGGRIFKALLPGTLQAGGCPDEFVQKVDLPPGKDIPGCGLSDHQLRAKTPRDVIDNIIN
ncbi:MAG: PBP1A family penicillin-binding protein [Syntrophomonadaceae bacterium]|nr:PBP1A family penicillin-binding protein [Syntrophomonadaceae bacterium]